MIALGQFHKFYNDICKLRVAGLILLALSVSLTANFAQATHPLKQEYYKPVDATLINDGWLYLENNTKSASDANKQTAWEKISLPHTWNATDTVDAMPGYRRNASWYKKDLNLKGGARYKLYFEGSNMETEVYLNGKRVGEHIGGYVGFEMEISSQVKRRGKNALMIRVSNEYNPNLIPSQKADFMIHGGITRDLWLIKLPETYIDHTQITTPEVSKNRASILQQVSIDRAQRDNGNYILESHLYDPSYKLLETAKNKVGKSASIKVEFASINAPQLWSVDSPNLYYVKNILRNQKGKAMHQSVERFGVRKFEMRPYKGFFINGERVLIRGTHRHEEHAGLGAALPNSQHRRDLEMMKEMGANFVRLGHYPQDPEVYRTADEIGLVIWDELPWCRGGKGQSEWESNTERLLRQQIQQNFNYPSIAFWSLGNEIYWEEDFPGGGATEVINPYLKKLNAITKKLDPFRMTTIRKYYPGAELVDAFSPSIWAGWYGGAYGQYEEALKNSMKKYPTFLHMEYGGSSHVGRHTENPISKDGIRDAQVSVSEAMNQAVVKSVAKDSDWNENYMVDLFDWHLKVTEQLPNFAGNAQWAFKDFATPLRPENPIPYVNQKGLVDRAGNYKDAYYVFASYWAKKPFCWIESKTWTHRQGPKEGRDVATYCNTKSAELFLNGRSLGSKNKNIKSFPASGLSWKVPFKNGINKLRVVGTTHDGKKVEDTHTLTYLIGEHGKFKQIKLTQKPLKNGNILIMAEAVDEDGNRVINHSERVYYFNIGEHGKLVAAQGTPNGSAIIEMGSGYSQIEFEPGDKPSTVELRTQNVKGVYINLAAKK